jgi:phosphate transport system substrate-binding protein
MKLSRIVVTALVLCAAGALGFSQSVELVGAGATFPAPFYTKIFDEYNKQFGVKVNYQSIGSGGGQAQIKGKTVDFGASDAFMSDADLQAVPAPLLHIPIVAGSVVVTYNLPGSPTLRLTPDIVADVFLGKIKNWSDTRIAALNPSLKLPATAITVVHRSDGSGTTAAFTDYLSKVSDEWKSTVGTKTSVSWPAGIGGKGNEGVAGLVKQLPGSMGYVELIYALQNKMPFATLKNRSGNWVAPSLASTSSAAAVAMPDDTRVSLTDGDSSDEYPIASLTYILVYKEQSYGDRAQNKVDALVKLLWWMTHDGQKYAEALQYAPLPGPAAKKAEAVIRSISYNGAAVMK